MHVEYNFSLPTWKIKTTSVTFNNNENAKNQPSGPLKSSDNGIELQLQKHLERVSSRPVAAKVPVSL